MSKKKQTIACYMRYNKATKLETNVNAMYEYAKTYNYDIENVLAEHRSGIAPISESFHNLIENPSIDIVITPSISCITRSHTNFLEIEQKIKSLKKSIITLDGCVFP